MRKFVKIAMIFVGTVLGIFIFNLVLYANSPGYRKTLGGMVEEKSYEQQEAVEDAKVQAAHSSTSEDAPAPSTEVVETVPDTKPVEEVAPDTKSETETETPEPEAEEKVVVDKTYHEDCGTGKGYWVITYSDGSVGLE
ncbi:hypothetical protein SAMN02910275_01048 [Butyrivibrio sp. INlla18]|uniref:hypothetical protein n=1 Tax=Butyrivibrio sp. INlla18 TaxID=1520806 RepID=UPI00088E9515|nr:hypothetical protein [Butyrivibrio sp. INlla18]SDA53357.1 hypothetical protein SAMN02910275_01048 [Butyrivibrio sp. INlla18]